MPTRDSRFHSDADTDVDSAWASERILPVKRLNSETSWIQTLENSRQEMCEYIVDICRYYIRYIYISDMYYGIPCGRFMYDIGTPPGST